MLVKAILFCFAVGTGPIEDWHRFEIAVRDGIITRDSARKQFPKLIENLISFSHQSDCNKKTEVWAFPLYDYGINDVGKGGFQPDIYYGGASIKGYNFFDGNKHGGHPAYDIFVKDKNFDCVDDITHMSIKCIAPVELTILSINSNWKTGSEIRGGNYIWAMNTSDTLLFYFAHLDTIFANPGACFKAGEVLATLGRSGKNAQSKKSPTHLHLMVLKVEKDFRIKPYDYFGKLK